jgi:hypothetical protein
LKIYGLWIDDWGLGLTFGDWDWPSIIGDFDWRLGLVIIGEQSAVGNASAIGNAIANPQSAIESPIPIGSRQSAIRESAICSRQSAIGNRESRIEP